MTNLELIYKLLKSDLTAEVVDDKGDFINLKKIIDKGVENNSPSEFEKGQISKLSRKLTGLLKEEDILEEDILNRYDNPEYWDYSLLEE